jgi:hypothetical protein
MLLLTASPTVAREWSSDRQLANEADRSDIVATGSRSAVVVWDSAAVVRIRTTVDDGATWSSAAVIGTNERDPVLAAAGRNVSLVTKRSGAPCAGESAEALLHRRSADGGLTWSAPRRLACFDSLTDHADGQVSVVFTHGQTGDLWARTSDDGGYTFAQRRFIGRTGHISQDGERLYSAGIQVAIEHGATYTAYVTATDPEPNGSPDMTRIRTVVRRSLDRAASFSSERRMFAATGVELDLVASGSYAAVTGWDSAIGASVYRRTIDGGVTWEPTRPISRPSDDWRTGGLRLDHRSGSLVATFTRARSTIEGVPNYVAHRESGDFGATWSPMTRASLDHDTEHVDAFVSSIDGTAVTQRQLVLYQMGSFEGPPFDHGLWVRRGAAP